MFGVVLAPALDLLYWAVKGGGAWRRGEGRRARSASISTAPAPGTPLTVVESLSHPSAELEEYLKTIPVARRVKAGSSLKFCWVAEGRADVYPRLGPTMEWDVAAGDCVYRQSGRDGERPSPLTYNKPDLRNPSFVIGLADDGPPARCLVHRAVGLGQEHHRDPGARGAGPARGPRWSTSTATRCARSFPTRASPAPSGRSTSGGRDTWRAGWRRTG